VRAGLHAAATTLRNVAASVRNAASLAGSLTFECSITFEDPSRGNPSAGPTSISPAGAIRFASGATARPASAAAATAVTPPPTKPSLQAMPALSSARTARARTPHGGASIASGSCPSRFHTGRFEANQSVRKAPSLKAEIASAVSELTARILHKDPAVTAIIVKSVDAADWFAGGKSLAEQSLASYWLDIHVSEGTNTKDEKAAYLAALFKRMGELLGPLHEESYAHVDEVKGDAYGFGGLTQERRYIAGKLEVPPQQAAA
jgi:4-oxalocrotonate tautomerase